MRHKLKETIPCHPMAGCPVEVTLTLIGGKWKGILLYELLGGPKRFQELRRALPAITQKMLTAQLRELEAHGLIHREVYSQVPPKVEYSLTPLGSTLKPIIAELKRWGEGYLSGTHPAGQAPE